MKKLFLSNCKMTPFISFDRQAPCYGQFIPKNPSTLTNMQPLAENSYNADVPSFDKQASSCCPFEYGLVTSFKKKQPEKQATFFCEIGWNRILPWQKCERNSTRHAFADVAINRRRWNASYRMVCTWLRVSMSHTVPLWREWCWRMQSSQVTGQTLIQTRIAESTHLLASVHVPHAHSLVITSSDKNTLRGMCLQTQHKLNTCILSQSMYWITSDNLDDPDERADHPGETTLPGHKSRQPLA